ncbi:hypothetical protein IMZ29_04735 [Achromobacter sp. GG226]|uniref:hypothetical protein n=1 Tax=Verticiella alkaliphila TaxID=2779529 RepID=UPI001C0C1693|nr:hypothetical protein [Verticiella sp. GG226]MBU4609875.1 hypothetical protein [Verticiella sp. GG226]
MSQPTGLRRAWMREIGIEHLWRLPEPPAVPEAVAAAPAPQEAVIAAEPTAPVEATPEPAPAEHVSAQPASTAPGSSELTQTPHSLGDAISSESADREPTPAAAEASEPVGDEPAASASADLFRREPLPDPYRSQSPSTKASAPSDEAPVHTRVPVADVYHREPYVDPAEASQAASEADAAPDAHPWVAVRAPATRPDQEDWLLVGDTLDKDVAAPGRQRFLTALLAAQGHALGDVAAWPQAAEEGAAALVVIGEAAMAALAPGGKLYAVGEIAVDGVPLPALLLPSLAQASLNAEGKAATWRGLLRLSAQVNGEPD